MNDYKKLGFKSGIEIHQQLDGKKLFCNCPVEIKKGNHDFEIVRRLKASAGESGKRDKAAEYEQAKNKSFKYLGYNGLNCLVETDEEPPHPVNEKALESAVIVSKLLNCKIVDQVEFMRKVVIDGSNVSGFQRTAVIGMNGFVEINGKKFGIETVCLEEEAAQTVKRTASEDTYNLSRLGIPLIEIATAPDMTNPEEVKEVASHIGMVLRSLNNCKRGIGSTRQDVNVSIKGGVRVEIKGFQDLKSIPKVIDKEIKRQLTVRKAEEKIPHVRKAETDFSSSYLRPMPGSARMYPETDVRPIIPNLSVKLPKLLSSKTEGLEKKYGISSDLSKELIKKGIDFEKHADNYGNVKPQLIAEFFITIPKELRRKHDIKFEATKNLTVLKKLNEGELTVAALPEVTETLARGKKVDYSKYKQLDDKKLKIELQKIVDANKGAPTNAIMGLAMREFKGKADGKKVMQILQEMLK